MSARQSQQGGKGQPWPGSNPYGYNPAQQGYSQNRLLDALSQRDMPEEPRSSPPTLANAFFKGVFEFPFYLSSLGCLLGTSLGLSFTFLVLVFAFDQGFSVGAAVRPLGQCAGIAFILTMGFGVAHYRSILEETGYGADAVEQWPDFDWRGWVLSFLFAAIVLGEAAAVSYVLAVPQLVGSPLPAVLLTFILFPIFLMSTLENDSPFIPVAMPVLRSLVQIWWAWLLLYAYSAVLLAGWLVVTWIGLFRFNPYLSVFVSGPLLAIVLMIYARLLGRLAWCASQQEYEEDED